jgi:hypothetical protein
MMCLLQADRNAESISGIPARLDELQSVVKSMLKQQHGLLQGMREQASKPVFCHAPTQVSPLRRCSAGAQVSDLQEPPQCVQRVSAATQMTPRCMPTISCRVSEEETQDRSASDARLAPPITTCSPGLARDTTDVPPTSTDLDAVVDEHARQHQRKLATSIMNRGRRSTRRARAALVRAAEGQPDVPQAAQKSAVDLCNSDRKADLRKGVRDSARLRDRAIPIKRKASAMRQVESQDRPQVRSQLSTMALGSLYWSFSSQWWPPQAGTAVTWMNHKSFAFVRRGNAGWSTKSESRTAGKRANDNS